MSENKRSWWEFVLGLFTAVIGLLGLFFLQSKKEVREQRKREIDAIDEASDSEIKKVVKENAEKSLESISDSVDHILDDDKSDS
ncbi:MAG: hypothetical protein COT84_01995 [Chlamydiae bacterium CG10_big_fil_rev_8_21_14_0_10_35_9]|nr:MAG: hypothetical protein COT84_01995 [Chlamydiae bacterium CG10_big_fil_rev_8_21_14_0_10_35_9]